ncbi:hypothetical protein [Hyphomicrobium sp.]|uniref:hypothetical protein n=1 Tax=Hyphomicrobium sp. TaxID=82 RepID=UPI003F728639
MIWALGRKYAGALVLSFAYLGLCLLLVWAVPSPSPTPGVRDLGSPQQSHTSNQTKQAHTNDAAQKETIPRAASQSGNGSNAAQKPGQTNGDDNEETAFKRRSELMTAIVALATVIQALGLMVTIGVMIFVSTRQLRAYIGVIDGKITLQNLVEGGRGFHVLVVFKNAGVTPARNFSTWFPMPVIRDVSETPFGETVPINERGGTSVVLPNATPGMEYTIAATEAEIADIRNGTKHIFVWGGADFKDVFGRPHAVVFRKVNTSANFMQEAGHTLTLRAHKAGDDES